MYQPKAEVIWVLLVLEVGSRSLFRNGARTDDDNRPMDRPEDAIPQPAAAPPRPELPPEEAAPPRVFFRLDLSRTPPYSRGEYVRKALWRVVQATAFRIGNNRVRVMLLRLFGADIHPTANIRGTIRVHHPWLLRVGAHSSIGERVEVYNLGPVVIGTQTSISQGVHICAGTHDWKNPTMPLVRSSITIGSGVWVCADAFIGPGVRVGNNSIIGARVAVMRDVPDDSTASSGKPVIGPRAGLPWAPSLTT